MAFGDVDLSAALTRLAERRIEEAMEAGKFDNLQGKGEPVNLDPLPADENARAMWWAMRIFRHNDVIPDEVRYRRTIDTLRAELNATRDRKRICELVGKLNVVIRKLNTMGTNVRPTDVAEIPTDADGMPLDENAARPASS